MVKNFFTFTAAAAAALVQSGSTQQFSNSTTESVNVRWISGTAPIYSSGTTFGLPWARGKFFSNSTTFGVSEGDLQSWVTAYWNDGSIKWTGHAIPAAETSLEEYTVTATSSDGKSSQAAGLTTSSSDDEYVVNTGKIAVTFPR
jgi:hypothetical protein